MAATWRRPALTAMEVLWRWVAGLPLLLLAVRAMHQALQAHPLNVAALGAMTVFQPLAALETLRRQWLPLLPILRATARWLLPFGVVLWVLASTVGRLAIWQRLDGMLPRRMMPVALFSLLRLLLLLFSFWLWGFGLAGAARYSIASAVTAGGEPNLVLFTALAVVWTLLLFLLWCVAVWPLDAAPLFAFDEGASAGQALRRAVASAPLRSKLVEINLVMGIVKVGLLVLAMVFSATPLPFAAEETQTFLVSWWTFVGLVFLIALDFFHVVRRAAYLAFFKALIPQSGDAGGP